MMQRSRWIVGGVAVAVVGLLVSVRVLSQEKQPSGAAEMAEAMAKWAEMNAMGPEHEKFKAMVGKWEAHTKMWMMPDAPPTEAQGTAEFRLVFGGRYVEQIYKCDMMGQPFEGHSLEGYDRFKKKWVSIWYDNMSTGIFVSEGTTDASGRVCTYYGTTHDPMTGELDKMTKSVAREINADKLVYEMYEMRAGVGEIKVMEITYTRKK